MTEHSLACHKNDSSCESRDRSVVILMTIVLQIFEDMTGRIRGRLLRLCKILSIKKLYERFTVGDNFLFIRIFYQFLYSRFYEEFLTIKSRTRKIDRERSSYLLSKVFYKKILINRILYLSRIVCKSIN